MNILYIDYDDLDNPYASGGQAYTTRELMKRLSRRHTITVVTGNYPGAKNRCIDGIHYVRLGLGSAGYMASIVSHWILQPWYVLMRQWHYDILIECLTAPFTTSFVPVVAAKPLVAYVSFFDSKKLSEKYHIPLDVFQTLLIRKYSRFIVLTDEIKNKILRMNRQAKCAVVPGGVEDDILRSKPVKGKYVLYVGRIDIYNKGLSLLLSAWRHVYIPLIIAGSGRPSEVTKIQHMISENKLQNRVTYIGRIAGEKKIDLYRKSLCIVQPSLFETFGYVALEALAAGKLLVCFDISGYKWIPAGLAIKIRRIDAHHLEMGIKGAIRSKKRLDTIRSAGKRFAKQFQWETISLRFEQKLLSLL